jgi:hypothetical protein
MTAPKPPKAPPGLGPSGVDLWASVVADFELGAHEATLLASACLVADRIAELETLLAEHGLMTVGASGQPRLSTAVPEIRQQRLALSRLLADLRLPIDDGAPMSVASMRAQRASRARWDRVASARSGRWEPGRRGSATN